MSKARDGVEDLKTIDANFAAKAPLASPVFTGNVGIGVTPETSSSGHTSFAVGGNQRFETNTVKNGGNYGSWMQNAHYEGSWKYISTGATSRMYQGAGTLAMQVAASGSAGAAISWNTAMTINNSGIVTKPKQPAFCMSVNAYSGINAAAGVHVIRFGNQNSGGVLFNNGNNFDTTNYRFVAPVSGFYQFNANIRIDSASGDFVYLTMTKNGSTTAGRDLDSGISSYNNRHVSQVLSLSANDYVDCNVRTSGDTSIGIDGDSYFSGHLIG